MPDSKYVVDIQSRRNAKILRLTSYLGGAYSEGLIS